MSDRAKLLYVFPSFGPGGTQLRMASIMNSLGHSFSHHVIAMDQNFEASAALENIHPILSGPPTKSAGLPYAFAFRDAVRALRPAAVLTYNWGAIDAAAGACLAALCPVIHNECGFGQDEATTLKRRRVWVRRLILKRAFRTVVTSQALLAIARTQYKLPSGKIQLIRTGVDAIRYQPSRNQAGRAALNVGDRTVLFGYVGGLRPEKNIGLLLRAFQSAAVPNAKLVLVGEGPCRRALESQVAELNLGHRVMFAGYQPDPAPYLSMLDVFVMCSTTEQVSNAQLEAMASGLPVICTDVGDSRDLLGESAGPRCVVPPNNEAAFARALRDIATDAEVRAELGAANRKRAVNHYSKERMVKEYAALLRSAITACDQDRSSECGVEDHKGPCTRLESGA